MQRRVLQRAWGAACRCSRLEKEAERQAKKDEKERERLEKERSALEDVATRARRVAARLGMLQREKERKRLETGPKWERV